jgi:hypothetical protein
LVRYIEENGGGDDPLTIQESSPKAYLSLLIEGRISHTFPLRGEIELGREKNNAIVVSDQKVSRHHAKLTPIDNTFIIHDQGSANGTYVNGVLIAQPTRLHNKDKIRIGDASFLFTTDEPDATIYDPLPSSVPVAPASSQPAPPAPVVSVTDNTKPIWVAIGCMAVAIIILLIVLALMLGLFVGRSQASLVLWWLASVI